MEEVFKEPLYLKAEHILLAKPQLSLMKMRNIYHKTEANHKTLGGDQTTSSYGWKSLTQEVYFMK